MSGSKTFRIGLAILGALLVSALPVLAQAPIPKALREAKTVYLINEGASPGMFRIGMLACVHDGPAYTASTIARVSSSTPQKATLSQPPVVSITSPVAEAVVQGAITTAATAFGADGVAGVQFMVDGEKHGPEDTTAPYTMVIDTRAYADGQHTISAAARDGAGKMALSAAVNVIIDNITVMPLGDSLTDGVVALRHSDNEAGGYRRYLWEKLNAAGISNVNFVGSLKTGVPTMDRDHEGHGGFRVDQITSLVSEWIQASPPDIILLLIGTNDFIQGATPAIALNRLSDLLDTIHTARPSARLVLATQPGVTPDNALSVNPQDILTYNLGMPALVNARAAAGWDIELLDLYTLSGLVRTSGSLDYGSDGLHFSLSGYRKLANVWYSVLDPAVSPETTPPTIPSRLSATGTSPSTIRLTWNGSVDGQAGLAVYRVYRNGIPLTTTTETSFGDDGLTANTTYSYAVTAIDFANNESSPSATVIATTGSLPPDVIPPGAPSSLVVVISPGRIDLSWRGATDVRPGASVSDGFDRADGELGAGWATLGGRFRIVRQQVEPAASAIYTIARLTTWSGSDSQWAEVAVAVTGSSSGGGPVVRARNRGADLYLVDYNGRADHKLYRVMGDVRTVLGGWTSPAANGDVVRLEAIGTTIRVLVNGVEKLSVIDRAVPDGVPGLYGYAEAGERVRLDGFTAASSGAEIVGYRVYRNGTLLATTSSNAYADTEVKGATGYSYTVTAVDGAGNESAPSAPASATTR